MKRSWMIRCILVVVVLLSGCSFRSRFDMAVQGNVQLVSWMPPQDIDAHVAWALDAER